MCLCVVIVFSAGDLVPAKRGVPPAAGPAEGGGRPAEEGGGESELEQRRWAGLASL